MDTEERRYKPPVSTNGVFRSLRGEDEVPLFLRAIPEDNRVMETARVLIMLHQFRSDIESLDDRLGELIGILSEKGREDASIINEAEAAILEASGNLPALAEVLKSLGVRLARIESKK